MRALNHVLSVGIEFVLAHPWIPGHFCAAVLAGVLTADLVQRARKRRH